MSNQPDPNPTSAQPVLSAIAIAQGALRNDGAAMDLANDDLPMVAEGMTALAIVLASQLAAVRGLTPVDLLDETRRSALGGVQSGVMNG